jgi:hypothetical protein
MALIPSTTLNLTMGTHVNPMTLAAHNFLPAKPVFQQSGLPPRLPGNVSGKPLLLRFWRVKKVTTLYLIPKMFLQFQWLLQAAG